MNAGAYLNPNFMVPINTVSKPNAIPFPHSPHQESAAAAAAGLQALVLRVRSLKVCCDLQASFSSNWICDARLAHAHLFSS